MLSDYDIQVLQDQEGDKIQTSEFESFIEMMMGKKTHLSFSSIKNFIPITGGNPYRFMRYKLKKFEATQAMILGDAIDVMILTPHLKDRFAVTPNDASFASKAGCEVYANWIQEHIPSFNPESIEGKKMDEQKFIIRQALAILEKEKTVISEDDYKLAQFISNRVLRNNSVNDILRFMKPEHTQTNVEFEAFGWRWRGKTDATLPYGGYLYKNGVVIDMKLMPDASPNHAIRTIRNEFYNGQGAIYTKGQKLDVPFLNICYDRSGGVSIIEHSERSIEGAWNDLETYMDQFNKIVSATSFTPATWFDSHTYWGFNGVHKMN
jgi:hypothetical protein